MYLSLQSVRISWLNGKQNIRPVVCVFLNLGYALQPLCFSHGMQLQLISWCEGMRHKRDRSSLKAGIPGPQSQIGTSQAMPYTCGHLSRIGNLSWISNCQAWQVWCNIEISMLDQGWWTTTSCLHWYFLFESCRPLFCSYSWLSSHNVSDHFPSFVSCSKVFREI